MQIGRTTHALLALRHASTPQGANGEDPAKADPAVLYLLGMCFRLLLSDLLLLRKRRTNGGVEVVLRR